LSVRDSVRSCLLLQFYTVVGLFSHLSLGARANSLLASTTNCALLHPCHLRSEPPAHTPLVSSPPCTCTDSVTATLFTPTSPPPPCTYTDSVTAKVVENWFSNHRRSQSNEEDGGPSDGDSGGGAGGRAFSGSETSRWGLSGRAEMGVWIQDGSDVSEESDWDEVLFRSDDEVLLCVMCAWVCDLDRC